MDVLVLKISIQLKLPLFLKLMILPSNEMTIFIYFEMKLVNR